MKAPESDRPWLEANQRALMQEVAEVRAGLGRHAQGEASRPADAEARSTASALDLVCARLALSTFERKIVVMCAAMELDGRFASACALAQGDPSRPYPTFGLALAVFDDAHWSALTPEAPLRRWGLVDLVNTGGLTSAPLRIDEWLLHLLTGTGGLDARLAPFLDEIGPATSPLGSHESAAAQITALWLSESERGPFTAVQLCGVDRHAKRLAVGAACARLGWHAWALEAAAISSNLIEAESLSRTWQRQALISDCALVIDADACGEPAERAAIARLADRVTTPLIILTRNATRVGRRATLAIEVAKPSRDEQRTLWRHVLGDEAAASLDGTLDAMLAQFDLDGHAIETAAAQASVRLPGADLGQRLWHSCRRGARTELDDVAQRIESTATPDDLVLPAPQRATLGDIAAHVRNRVRVYDDWRMGGPSARGLGISALFAGPSGTGKTLAAEVIAHQLELDLYRIDLSQVISKFIGETERNLRRVFDAADEGGAVLLFDEADALFGKRSEVRDSHDRYANVEISYLLQRMESYRGLAILTTNMRTAIDPAFMRRLRFVVTFPFPDLEQREAIWRRAFPATAPTRGLDHGKLARLTVSGGNIRNIALYAAFLAADGGEPIGMAHLLRAAQVECAKLERTPAETELGGWV